jgi:hypothetical protein
MRALGVVNSVSLLLLKRFREMTSLRIRDEHVFHEGDVYTEMAAWKIAAQASPKQQEQRLRRGFTLDGLDWYQGGGFCRARVRFQTFGL